MSARVTHRRVRGLLLLAILVAAAALVPVTRANAQDAGDAPLVEVELLADGFAAPPSSASRTTIRGVAS